MWLSTFIWSSRHAGGGTKRATCRLQGALEKKVEANYSHTIIISNTLACGHKLRSLEVVDDRPTVCYRHVIALSH
ncbi:MAG TPA: hypothetical protein VM935_17660, partial [Chitinophagaceae bacterium]|nr:hypothetical protein [Chitinophagaceae bacterium]